MDGYSNRVVCGNCGTENIYNPEYYSKDKCQKCGELLHQYLGQTGHYKNVQLAAMK